MEVSCVFVDPSGKLKYRKNEYTWRAWSVFHLEGLYNHQWRDSWKQEGDQSCSRGYSGNIWVVLNLDNPLYLSLILIILCCLDSSWFRTSLETESERMAAGWCSQSSGCHTLPTLLLREVRAQAGSSGGFILGSPKPPRTEPAGGFWAPIPSWTVSPVPWICQLSLPLLLPTGGKFRLRVMWSTLFCFVLRAALYTV